MNTPTPTASVPGVLGNLGGLATQAGMTSNLNQAAGLAGSAPGATNANTVRGPGGTTSLAGGVTNINPTGALGAANTGIQNLAATGANAANNALVPGALPTVTNASNNANNAAAGQLGVLGGIQGNNTALTTLGANQLSNPLIGQADAAASSNIAQAGTDFNSVYNTQLSALMQQLQLPQQLQMNANNQGQFSRGQMGTTGGGLQTQAMATGFGQADIAAASQAYNQAMATQQQATSAAGVLGTLGSNQQLTGANMIGTGTGATNATAGNMSNIGTTGLTNAIAGVAAPATVAGAINQDTVTPSVANTNAITNTGINQANLGVNTGGVASNSALGASNALTNISNASGTTSNAANVLNSLSGLSAIPGVSGALTSAGGAVGSALSGAFGGGNNPASVPNTIDYGSIAPSPAYTPGNSYMQPGAGQSAYSSYTNTSSNDIFNQGF